MDKIKVAAAIEILKQSVDAEAQANETLKMCVNDYTKELQKFQEDNHDLVSAHVAAQENYNEAKAAKSKATKAIREIMPDYFSDNPEARDETPGVSYRLERKPDIDKYFVENAVKAGATFLLKPDDKALKNFVQGMAIQDKQTKLWMLPDSIYTWLDESLRCKNDYVVTISEAKLIKSDDTD